MYDKFEALLKERNLRASDVAKQTGISTTTLSAWKLGKYEPKQDKMQKIADFFGVPISYFYDDTPSYYFDENVADLAEELHVKPGLRILFDASRDLKEDSLKMFAEMIETYKKTNPDG